ncbi:hypothetical protein MFLO_06787 [Listeria floridensis FSL S10-1187]|uniref:Thioesterase domain-containing protein n=1 Tax=Listeria floridensis FSL S10-1187 TaxID=1265817 RepID=A0ABN0RFQ5_9LIST|nr:PaaI family thioesterase [Listeria floridensis]EUJ32413.1 hypothetical protein MFLO_06787 [Listeria floridensis FSL S10-1187]
MDFAENIGIETISVSTQEVELKLVVTDKVKQPFGFLHGGVSVALAEHAASIGAKAAVPSDHVVFGLEINANHIKSVSEGVVTAKATPIHQGRSTQVWQIIITNESGETICVSRCTLAVRPSRTK